MHTYSSASFYPDWLEYAIITALRLLSKLQAVLGLKLKCAENFTANTKAKQTLFLNTAPPTQDFSLKIDSPHSYIPLLLQSHEGLSLRINYPIEDWKNIAY